MAVLYNDLQIMYFFVCPVTFWRQSEQKLCDLTKEQRLIHPENQAPEPFGFHKKVSIP
jgi:hypothetical protein